MRMLLATLLIVLLSLLASGVYIIAAPADSPMHTRFEKDAHSILAVLPDPATRRSIAARAENAAHAAERIASKSSERSRFNLQPAASVIAVRSAVALATGPLLLALLVLGTIAGLLRRDWIRDTFGFASLTFSYAGKAIVSLSLAAYIVTGLSPLGPAVWWLYLFGLSGGLGSCLYFGNLPPKL